MGAAVGKGSGPVSDLNLTPLIDIVLVVLIIMMVNIPIQIEEMIIKLPAKKDSPTPPSDAEQLVISLYENGELALNRMLMVEDDVFVEVTRRLRPMQHKNVFIDAAPTVRYGRVVDMVDLARGAGAAKVGLARLKEDGPLEALGARKGVRPPGVTFGNPGIRGEGISAKTADQTLAPLRGAIQQCYMDRLASEPDLTGRLSLKMVLGPQGEHMEEPGFLGGDTMADDELKDCIHPLVQDLVYAPLGEGNTAIVYYPLLFSPGK